MSKEYSQQHITQFFQEFKKLENNYPIEKVHQIINDPNARARYKVKNVQPLNLIIMTFLISLSIVLALWFSSPDSKYETPVQSNAQIIEKDSRTKEKASALPIDSVDEEDEQSKAELVSEQTIRPTKTSEKDYEKSTEPQVHNKVLSDTVIDGSKFILELSNKELEKLGFQIDHYKVYYRNSYHNVNVFYLLTHSNGRFFVRGDSLGYNLKDYYPLQTDTIPEGDTLKYMKTIKISMVFSPKNSIREDIVQHKSTNSFYPVFNTNQAGEIEKIQDDLKFEEFADTLIPVVVKCSQLDLEKKRDQFFWFTTNDDFYLNLPERYSWVKDEFDKLKAEKRKRQSKLRVDFKTEDWNKDQLIPDNVILDGHDYIIQLTNEEIEKTGVFDKGKALGEYCHMTPYGGSAAGGKMEMVDGRPEMKFDSVWNTDYFIKYGTDCTGDFLGNQTTIKRMDDFFNEDDILLPVQVENKNGNIYWFTLSENFWELVPERYQYLKAHYNQMLYNKSIEPNRDFVRYFTDPFKKIGVNVSIIDLNKEELENLGFKFVDGGTEISCGFGKNWIKYWFKDNYINLPEKMHRKIKKRPPFEFLQYFAPSKEYHIPEVVEKYDSLYAASNQGYQYVYITDSLGRHTQRINIPRNDLQINGEDFKYLIPVMVRFSKFTNPLSEDRVFWFTPTEAFFNRLPDRIKNELKEEYEIVSSEGQSSELSACTYFESCRSTLKVDNLKIYPNPAQNEITIDFNLDMTQEGEISLANIAGLQIKVLKPKSTFDEGFNSIKCQLEGIKPGIYLVSIITDAGFKTERIIVTE